MNLADVEGEARWMIERAGLDDSEAVKMLELAKKLMGPTAVVSVQARALPGPSALVTVHGERRIYVRKGLNPKALRWAIAHELAHWALRLDSSTVENEDACDALAACLIAPRFALRNAFRDFGARYRLLAQSFNTTETCVALRLAEITDEPTLVLTPARARVRGAEFVWPQSAFSLGQANSLYLRTVRLGDDATRWVRIADGDAQCST